MNEFLHNQPLVASTLYCMPWHILPGAHGELGDLYQKYRRGELEGRSAAERPDRVLPGARSAAERVGSGLAWAYDEDQGLAIVWLDGVIGKRMPESMSGPAVTDLAKLDRIVKQLMEMDRIETVVLSFDSPGGCSVGLVESAELLGELAVAKTVAAYTDCMMCSAAYWLAAAADEIGASPSSMVGSIGTYIAALDSSRAFEMEGLELKLYRHGSLKALGMPGKAWTEEEESYLAEMAARHGEEFRSWVTSRRGALPEGTMEGQWFFGAEAPEGLVDGIYRDLEEFIGAIL